jgi:hypothetical protein
MKYTNDHTSVEISSPHYCWFCGEDGKPNVVALYDAKTVMGQWADMCEKHNGHYGMGLGLGIGQRLILKTKGFTPDESPIEGETGHRFGDW